MGEGLAGPRDLGGGEPAGVDQSPGVDGGVDPVVETLRRANVLESFGRLTEAIAELRLGVGASPDSAPLWSRLGWLLYRNDEFAESRFAAERALALDPYDAVPLLTMALLEIEAGAAAAAHGYADRALALVPDAPTAHLVKAMAFAVEPRGAVIHRQITRDAAYYAVSLAPEDPDILYFAARVLQPVAGKKEVAALVDRGLALNPEHEDLLLLATEVHAKSDVQSVRGWSRVLAQNPRKVGPAFGVELFVWERTRLVSSLALWLIPAIALGAATVVAPLLVLVVTIRNLWDLLVGSRRSAPKGLLGRVWGEPPWARTGVVLVFVGAAWPLLAAPIALSRQVWLFAVPALALCVGETMVVIAGQMNERKHLGRLGRSAALELVDDFASRAHRGWLRISIAALLLVVACVAGASAAANPLAAQVVIVLVSLAAAFAVPPAVVMARYRRTRREFAARPEGRDPSPDH